MAPTRWSRIRAFFARLFGHKPPEPGRYVPGAKWAWRGGLTTVPWLPPRREYLVYVPRGYSRWQRRPMLVLIHGCKQTPEEFAAGTRIAALADREGWLVLLPRQARPANPWGCWNWFENATARGWGETAIVAAQVRKVRRRFRADPRRIVVAGMSSGGGLAATLGMRRPDLFAGAFIHSGVACAAATSPLTALGVLASGPDADVEKIGGAARERAGNGARIALMTVQGEADNIVAPRNAVSVVRQYLAFDRGPPRQEDVRDALPSGGTTSATTVDGRPVTTTEFRDGARLVARHIVVGGLAHAWSGGDAAYPFNDAHAPDATAMLGDFVREVAA
jgi:poly(hydroxyalkanoate) depolymerase family esterase